MGAWRAWHGGDAHITTPSDMEQYQGAAQRPPQSRRWGDGGTNHRGEGKRTRQAHVGSRRDGSHQGHDMRPPHCNYPSGQGARTIAKCGGKKSGANTETSGLGSNEWRTRHCRRSSSA